MARRISGKQRDPRKSWWRFEILPLLLNTQHLFIRPKHVLTTKIFFSFRLPRPKQFDYLQVLEKGRDEDTGHEGGEAAGRGGG